ncbi:MAG: rhomboid family intramembrane serine protease [Crocinitomicaceae bacterium]|nr:rhomboid family intramembrane serine protease [Crocinitomicaceae bacterium]
MLQSIFRNMPPVVKNLLIINLIMFLATVALQDLNLRTILSLHYPESSLFQPYQFVTSIFMHGDFGHIFFNMFGLVMFGTVLEKVWGAKRMLIFFLACGIGANVIYEVVQYIQIQNFLQEVESDQVSDLINLLNTEGADAVSKGYNYSAEKLGYINSLWNGGVLGASGAIFGILIAFAMLFPNTELMLIFLPVPIKAKYLIPIYVIIELFLGVQNFQWDNVAHFAHLGGALIGFVFVKIWQKDRTNFY